MNPLVFNKYIYLLIFQSPLIILNNLIDPIRTDPPTTNLMDFFIRKDIPPNL